MIIFNILHRRDEVIYFINLSGSVELRARKTRIMRYMAVPNQDKKNDKKNDKFLQYLRRKIGDKLIYKIIPYKNITTTAQQEHSNIYTIIRHPLQDINEFRKAYTSQIYDKQCEYTNDEYFIKKHIELFNSLDFVYKFCECTGIGSCCHINLIPDRFKKNKHVSIIWALRCCTGRRSNFECLSYIAKSSKKNILYIINKVGSFRLRNLFPELPYKLREDPEILSKLLSGFRIPKRYDSMTPRTEFYSYKPILDHIPNNIINNIDYLLKLHTYMNFIDNYDISEIYRYLSIETKRNYKILLKFGYKYISDKDAYNEVMTPEMKSDIELHKKLVKLNPSITYAADLKY
jgi:hypothetical protein